MKQPNSSIGIAYNKQAAKELRKEMNRCVEDGRKAHYLKMPGIERYWVWISGKPRHYCTCAKPQPLNVNGQVRCKQCQDVILIQSSKDQEPIK